MTIPWRALSGGILVTASMAGCAWFQDPPSPIPTRAAGERSASQITPPDSAVSDGDSTAVTSAIDSLGAAPDSALADTTLAGDEEIPEEALEGPDRWVLDGDELNSETGSEGQVITVVGPVITHRDIRITADRGRYEVDRNRAILMGNVAFSDSGITGESDEATYYRTTETLFADGNVLIDSDTLRAAGDEARYYRRTNTISLTGNVEGWRGERYMIAKEAIWVRDRNAVTLKGNVILTDGAENTRLFGEEVIYDLATDEARVIREPRLVLRSDGENSTTILGDQVIVKPDGDAHAVGSVRVHRGGVVATADSAAFLRKLNQAVMVGFPKVTDQDGTLTGDTLYLHFDDDQGLNRVDMHGHADVNFAPQDTLRAGEVSTVQGDSLTMFFEDDAADRVVVFGDARSTYRPSPNDLTEGTGTNAVKGDTITIFLDEGLVDRVRVFGNAQGVFTFVEPAADTVSADDDEDPPQEAAADDTTGSPADTEEIGAVDSKRQQVLYAADEVIYSLDHKTVDMIGTVNLDYGGINLTAGKVKFYALRRYLEAEDDPVLIDRESQGDANQVVGKHMDYNLDSREGTIDFGRTKAEDGFIYSDRLRQIGDGEYISKQGNFTTCDLAEHDQDPHFHFTSKRMRIYLNDKVIARPVTLYIRDIPILAVPFYVFSVGKGRRSGFLTPDFSLGLGGTDPLFNNVGYYWAASEYYDFTLRTNYNGGNNRFEGRLETVYAKRYLMNGTLQIASAVGSGSKKNEIVGAHSMTLGAWKLTGRASFRDQGFRTEQPLTGDLGTRLDRLLTSSLSANRAFGFGGQISLDFRRDQDLDATFDDFRDEVRINETLPRYSFTVNSRPLGRPNDPNGEGGRLPWLSTFRVGFNSTGSTTRKETEETSFIIGGGDGGGTGQVPVDTTFALVKTRDTSARHVFRINDTRRILGALNLSPQFSLTENWVDREFSETDTVKGFNRAATWNASVSANGAAYGMFPGLGPVQSLRHTFRPSASFVYSPDFASLKYVDSDGIERNRYPGVSSFESRQLVLSMANAFEAKVRSGEDVRRTRLFDWSAGSSYDFVRADQGLPAWSDVRSTVALSQIQGVALNFNSVHDPYNQFRFKTFQASGGFSLRGTLPGGETPEATLNPPVHPEDLMSLDPMALGADPMLRPKTQGSRAVSSEALNWNARFTFSYGGARDFTDQMTTQASLNTVFGLQLTQNWSVNYSNRWDITGGQILADQVELRRELHCWEASFSRNRLVGSEPTFYFRINVKALGDLKYEQGPSGGTGVGSLSESILP